MITLKFARNRAQGSIHITTLQRHQLFLLRFLSWVSETLKFIWSGELIHRIGKRLTGKNKSFDQKGEWTTCGICLELFKMILFGFVTYSFVTTLISQVGLHIQKINLKDDDG